MRWLVLSVCVAGLAGLAGLAGCAKGEHPSVDTVIQSCVPGDQKACACPGGAEGVQICADDGSRYQSCGGCPASGSGGGPGAMDAALRGHARADTLLDLSAKKAGRATEAHEPQRQAGNIIIGTEQAANPFVDKDHLATFDRFLFRMEFLFRNTTDFIATPGGFGTVAETFTFMAMKSHGQVGDPIVFGAPDDFFQRYNAAFEPFLNEKEKPDLKNIFDDAAELVKFVGDAPDTVPEEVAPQMVARMRDQLELGLSKLDGKPPAVVFFGGAGARSRATAQTVEEIAAALGGNGVNMRVVGSPIIDQAVLKGARKANPNAEVEAFAMEDAPVTSEAGLDYTKVRDVLVLRELADTNIKGMVVTPEGAKQIALMFTAACDMQTKEMKKLPIIVLDPDGKFATLKKELAALMLSDKRKYINPEDLDLFTVTNDAKTALQLLNAPAP